MKQVIRHCVFLLCGVWTAAAQTNVPARPTQPTRLLTKVGECESRIGGVEVVVSGVVEPGKAMIRIQCRLNHMETTCEVEPANALAIAQLIETIASDSRNGKQSAGQCKNVQVSAFELQDKKFVEIMFHQGDASAGESGLPTVAGLVQRVEFVASHDLRKGGRRLAGTPTHGVGVGEVVSACVTQYW